MKKFEMKKFLWNALALAALACTSCRNSNNLYPVSGTINYQGKPAAGASVFFVRQGSDPMNEHTIMGIVKKDGIFTLVCGSLGEGAPPGEYGVLIEWKQSLNQAKGLALARKGQDRLQGRFADPKRPRFHVVVKAETNHLAPFEITD